MEFGLGLTIQELTRLMRYVDKEADGLIDYSKFLKSVKKIDCKQERTFKWIWKKFITFYFYFSFFSLEMPEGENAFVDAGDFGDKLIRFLKRNAIRSGEELVKCLANYQRKIGG